MNERRGPGEGVFSLRKADRGGRRGIFMGYFRLTDGENRRKKGDFSRKTGKNGSLGGLGRGRFLS